MAKKVRFAATDEHMAKEPIEIFKLLLLPVSPVIKSKRCMTWLLLAIPLKWCDRNNSIYVCANYNTRSGFWYISI